MDMRYNLVSEFDTNGKHMVTVMIDGNAHIMEDKDLRWVFGQSHPERWNRKRKNGWKKGA